MNEVTKENRIKVGLYIAVVLSIIMLPIIFVWVGYNGIGAITLDFLTVWGNLSTDNGIHILSFPVYAVQCSPRCCISYLPL